MRHERHIDRHEVRTLTALERLYGNIDHSVTITVHITEENERSRMYVFVITWTPPLEGAEAVVIVSGIFAISKVSDEYKIADANGRTLADQMVIRHGKIEL